MPLYSERRETAPVSDFARLTPPQAPDGSVAGAAFSQENLVANAFQTDGVPRGALLSDEAYVAQFEEEPQGDFNAWSLIEGTEYEEHWQEFAGVRSLSEVLRLKKRIDREMVDRRILDNAGGRGVAAQLFAGLVDVPTLVPGGAAVRGATRGYNVTRNAANASRAALKEAAAVETALQTMQTTRTGEESAVALGGSVILGAILGGTAGALVRRAPDGEQAYRNAGQWLDGKDVETTGWGLDQNLRTAENDSLSAARVDIGPVAEDFELPTKAAQTALNVTPSGVNFGLTFLKARSPVAQKVGLELVDTPYAIRGVDRLEMEPAVEIAQRVSNDRARIAIATTLRDEFSDYRKAAGGTRVQEALGYAGSGNMTQRQFGEQVARAMRRGDQSDIPQVARAAQKLRSEVVEPLKERAIKAGLLPEDVEVSTAASYFTRVWNTREIVRREGEFKSKLTTHFQKGFRASRAAGEEDFDGLADQELDDYAAEAAGSIYSTLVDRVDVPAGLNLVAKVQGPLRERTLNVQDLDFEEFLVSDAELVLNRYARQMSADVEMVDRFGSADLSQQVSDIRADYEKIRKGVADPDELDRLKAEEKRVIERLEAVRDLLRGTYQLGMRAGIPYRIMQSVMSYNYIRALGGLVLSALPDVYRMAMVHGVKDTWEGAVAPLIRNTKQFRAQSKELSELAGISETALNNRLMAIADVTDPLGNRTPVENSINWMSSVASTWSGATIWNDFLKEMAAMTTTRRLRYMTGTKADKAMLQRLKINSRDAAAMQKAMKEHGVEAGGVFDPMVSAWPERIRDIYAKAIRADADTVIVTPGLGDKVPAAEAHPWMKPALQFKNFALAAHGRVMIAGMQEDQARFLSSAAAMASVGMFVYFLKGLGTEDGPSDNVGTWIAEGIDRSGVFPLVMEGNNMLESMNIPGVYGILSMGEEEASRYAVRSFAGKIAGPTFGLLNDTFAVGSRVVPALTGGTEEISPGDISAARRLIPFGRHPGAKEFLDLWLVPQLKVGLE